MKVHLLHGIHTKRGSESVVNLRPHIAKGSGLPVVYHEYGDIWALSTRHYNPRIAAELMSSIKPGDVLVGHSNGCAIWMRCLELGAPAAGLVLLNAALRDDILFPSQLKFAHVYFNCYDEAVPLTSFPVLQQLFFDPLWGDMGRDGWRGDDKRVAQFDCWNREDELPGLSGHSSITHKDVADDWGLYIGARIADALKDHQVQEAA